MDKAAPSVELPLVEEPVERYERLNIRSDPETHVGPSATDRRKLLYIEDNLTLVQRIVAEREGIDIIPVMQDVSGSNWHAGTSPPSCSWTYTFPTSAASGCRSGFETIPKLARSRW